MCQADHHGDRDDREEEDHGRKRIDKECEYCEGQSRREARCERGGEEGLAVNGDSFSPVREEGDC